MDQSQYSSLSLQFAPTLLVAINLFLKSVFFFFVNKFACGIFFFLKIPHISDILYLSLSDFF